MPWLTKRARISLIVPGMSHTLLVYIKVLTDAGCKVIYDKDDCRVYLNTKGCMGWRQGTNHRTLVLPINPIERNIQPRRHLDVSTILHDSKKHHMTASAYTMTSKEYIIKYVHQCIFSPTKRTLVKAIENKQLATWPGIT